MRLFRCIGMVSGVAGAVVAIAVGAFASGAIASGAFASGAMAQTLKRVQERGALRCGISEGVRGFSQQDANGRWRGFDADYCRAVAAAIFGDGEKVVFTPLPTADRFAALTSDKIDILIGNATWTMERETAHAISFVAINYFDAQGFLVRRDRNIGSARELNNAQVCVQTDTTTQQNLAEYFAARALNLEIVTSPSFPDLLAAYQRGRCIALTSDMSRLHAERLGLERPDEHVVLGDAISREPLGPAVRQDDMQWHTLVKWVHFALVNAEALGVSRQTLDAARESTDPAVRRLLGVNGDPGASGDSGAKLGVANDWVVSMIRAVGNYGEIFDRNLGGGSSLGIERGANDLWIRGGLIYAPPLR